MTTTPRNNICVFLEHAKRDTFVRSSSNEEGTIPTRLIVSGRGGGNNDG